jgi:low affinity Fe/Cu permease
MFDRVSTVIARAMGRPITFIVSFLIVFAWSLAGPVFHFSDSWQLVINTGSSIVTFLMVFIIQNTQNREGDAIQAKLDRLIRALEASEPRYAGLEERVGKEVAEAQRRRDRETNFGALNSDPADDKPPMSPVKID